LLALVGLWAAMAAALPLRGVDQDKQEDKAVPNKQSDAKKDKKENSDKKDNSKDKSAASTVTITVVNEKELPIKNAVVELYSDTANERKTTGADGKVSFQTRVARPTLRVTADRMEPYQKILQLSGDSAPRVILKQSN
jgi:hypothetical protein